MSEHAIYTEVVREAYNDGSFGELAGLAITQAQREVGDSMSMHDRHFYVRSEDHALIEAKVGEESTGALAYSVTRGAGFGHRGQFADVSAQDDETRGELVRHSIEVARARGDDRIYLQAEDQELINWHIANGATDLSGKKVIPDWTPEERPTGWDPERTIYEKEMTFRYDVNDALALVEENRVELPEGYTIDRFIEYDESSAAQVASLMPQLDSNFTGELTDERRLNYQHMIDSDDYTIMLVKDAEGIVVGTLSLTKSNLDTWQLEDVILDEKHRGGGRKLGVVMMQRMVDWAHEDGIETINLQTEAHRPSAVKLYFGTGAEMLDDTKTLSYALDELPKAA